MSDRIYAVKVVKFNVLDNHWYKGRIGEIFLVRDAGEGSFRLVDEARTIRQCDAEILGKMKKEKVERVEVKATKPGHIDVTFMKWPPTHNDCPDCGARCYMYREDFERCEGCTIKKLEAALEISDRRLCMRTLRVDVLEQEVGDLENDLETTTEIAQRRFNRIDSLEENLNQTLKTNANYLEQVNKLKDQRSDFKLTILELIQKIVKVTDEV